MNSAMKGMKKPAGRRSFLKRGVAAGAATLGGGLLGNRPSAFAWANHNQDDNDGAEITRGDIWFLAAELLESDLWQQYNERGGVDAANRGDLAALQMLDGDMPQDVADNSDDEISHERFLNGYLASKGAEQINFDGLRPLPTSAATGAQQIGRLTNLMELSVDTSWWTTYRSAKNPDFGATLLQAIQSLSIGKHPAIPRNTGEHGDSGNISAHVQAFANTAGWHFAFTGQGGSRLCATMVLS
jgi:hypothetical protein